MDVILPNMEDMRSPAVAFCIPCLAVFPDRASVEDHASTCRSYKEKPFKCIQCNSLFQTKDLGAHLAHFDSYPVYYTCLNVCSEGFVAKTPADVRNHSAYHNPARPTTVWKCSVCFATLEFINDKNVASDVESHTLGHRRRGPKRRITTVDEYLNRHPQLRRSRVTISALERTIASTAYKRTSVTQSNREPSPATRDSLQNYDFKCLHCKTVFSSPDDLQAHYLAHHQIIPADKIKVEPEFENLSTSQELMPEQSHSVVASTSQKRKVSSDEAGSSAKRRKLEKWTVRKKSQDNEASKDYFYFCCDCEKSRVGCHEGCDHFSHPRFPIGFDISGHMLETGHASLCPIPNFLPAVNVRLENLSLSRTHGHAVRKKWKVLVKEGLIRESVYTAGPRSCISCGAEFQDSLAMFTHVKETHLRKFGKSP